MNDQIDRLDIEPMEPRPMTRTDASPISNILKRSRPWLLAGAMVSCFSIAAVVSTQAQVTPPGAPPKSAADQLREKIAAAAAEGRTDSNGMQPTTSGSSNVMPASSDSLPDMDVPSLTATEPAPAPVPTPAAAPVGAQAEETTRGLAPAGSSAATEVPDTGAVVMSPPSAASPRNLEITAEPSTAPVGAQAVETTRGLAPAGSNSATEVPDGAAVVSSPAPMAPQPTLTTTPVEIPAALLGDPEPTAVTTTRGLDQAGSASATATPATGAITTGTADAPAPAKPSEMLAQPGRIYIAPQDDRSDLILQGEYAERTFHFNVPYGQVANGAKLILAYTNSIQNLPELSNLEVRLNNRPIALLPLNAFNARNAVEIELPAFTMNSGTGQESLLQAGDNRLTFIARQRHRVTCSLDGTFELITEIAADQTYIQFNKAVDTGSATLVSLDNKLGAIAGNRPLVIYSDRLGVEHQTWGADVAQGYALRVGERRAIVQHQPLPRAVNPSAGTMFPGIDASKVDGSISVLIGSRTELSGIVSRELSSQITGPFIGIYPLSADKNMVVVSGRSDEDVGIAAEQFKMPGATVKNSAVIVFNSDNQLVPPTDDRLVVQPEAVHSLGEFGLNDMPTNASRQVFSVPVRMPPDLYIADDSLVTVSVNGAYMSGLAPDAILNIFVNGRITAGIRLDQPQGEIINNRVVSLPMREFKPGLNLVEFEAKLPLSGGGAGACNTPVTPRTPEEARFTLYNTTKFKFPAYPRLGLLPDLHTTATTAFPYYYLGYYGNANQGAREAHNFFVPGIDSASTSAAWTVIAKLAQTAKQPLKMDAVSGGDINSISSNVLLVGPLDTLETGDYLRSAPLRGQALHQAWDNHRFIDPIVSSQRDMDAQKAQESLLSRVSNERRASEAPANINPVAPVSQDDVVAFNRDLRERQRIKLEQEQQKAGVTKSEGFFTSLRRSITEFMSGREQDPNQTTQLMEGGADMPTAVIMQYESPYQPSATWTVLTAPDNTLLWAAARRIVTPSYWNRLDGEVTTFGPNPNALRWRSPSQTYYVSTRELNITNAQLIIGNWFSKNIVSWTFIIMGLLVVLGIVTHMLVSRFGQSPIPGETNS